MPHAQGGERRRAEAGREPGEPHVNDRQQRARERERGAHAHDDRDGAPIGRRDPDQPAPQGDRHAEQEPSAPHHHRRQRCALHTQLGERADAGDQERVQADREEHRPREHQEGRARVAGSAERRLEGEESEDERPAQEPGREIDMAERGDVGRHRHQAEEPVGDEQPHHAHDAARDQRVHDGGGGGAGRALGIPLPVSARRDGDEPDLHHLAEAEGDPDVEAGGGHRRERRRPDQPSHPDAVDEIEAEVARHHRHGGCGEPEDHRPQRPDGERARGHGAAGTSARKRWKTGLRGYCSASRST